MDIKNAKKAMLAYMQHDIPTFLWGAPGVGKSDAVRQVADELEQPVIDFRAILRDPVDIRGLPAIDNKAGIARWLPPSDLPNEDRDGAEGILFMDELNAAPQAVQAACFGLVLDRKVGEYHLPPGWRIIAAGNRSSDRAAAQRMPTALANRFAHIDVETSTEAWAEWANTSNLAPEIVAFIRFRPALLHAMDTASNDLRTFPTPRAWANVAKFVNSTQDTDFRFQLSKGLVGEGPAIELEGFLRIYQNLPSLAAILSAPKQTKVPDEVAARFAIASGLARKVTTKNFQNALSYAERMPKEFEVMMVLDAIKRDNKLSHTNTFVEWASKNQNVTT